MQSLHLLATRYSLLATLCSIVLLFSGCASGVQSADTKLIAQIGVTYAVAKVAGKNPEKAAKIIAISGAVRAIAGKEGFNTVDLLMAYVRSKVDLSTMKPEDAMLASLLLTTIEARLKADPRLQVGGGVLTSDKLLVVSEFAGWIEDAAKPYAKPAA